MPLTDKERQALLDNISEEDLKKIQIKKGGAKIRVTDEDILEAEFLMKYGFEAYWAINPEYDQKEGIGIDEMYRLLAAGRKVEYMELYNNAVAAYIGASSAMSKKGPKSSLDKIIKQSEADQ